MKFRYFHLDCFTCSICKRKLIKGQLYGVSLDEQIYCEQHYGQYGCSTSTEINCRRKFHNLKNKNTRKRNTLFMNKQHYFDGKKNDTIKKRCLSSLDSSTSTFGPDPGRFNICFFPHFMAVVPIYFNGLLLIRV